MASDLTCPGCGTVLKVPAGFAGRTARCPKCRGAVPLAPAGEVLELDDEPVESFAFTAPARERTPERPAVWGTPTMLGVALAAVAAVGIGLYFAFSPAGRDEEKVETPRPASGGPTPSGEIAPRVTVKPGTATGEWNTAVVPFPTSNPVGPGIHPKEARENSLYGLAHDTVARLPDGPAAVTAAHLSGFNLAVGYADGSTAVWDLDKPITDAPLPGPKFAGRVENIWLGAHDRYIIAEVGGELRGYLKTRVGVGAGGP